MNGCWIVTVTLTEPAVVFNFDDNWEFSTNGNLYLFHLPLQVLDFESQHNVIDRSMPSRGEIESDLIKYIYN